MDMNNKTFAALMITMIIGVASAVLMELDSRAAVYLFGAWIVSVAVTITLIKREK